MTPRIGYVEDDPLLLELMSRYLAGVDVHLHIAADGAGGLAMLQGLEPDLVLLDGELPDMTAREFLMAMAADDTLRAIPVVVVTGSTLDRLGLPGGVRHIPKPFRSEEIFALLADAFPQLNLASGASSG